MTQATLEVASVALVHGTILAAATWLVVRSLRPRPSIVAALWILVLLKFLLPIGPGLAYSPSDLIERVRGGHEQAAALGPLPATGIPQESVGEGHSGVATAIVAAWALIAALLLVRSIRGAIMQRRWLRRLAAADESMQSEVQKTAAHLGVRCPAVRVSDQDGPCVVGWWRPVLVLPSSLCQRGQGERTAVIAHELAHVGRRDSLWALLPWATRILFFFWPPVRWVAVRYEAARELACDARALAASAIAAPAYARLLVAYAPVAGGGMRLAARSAGSLGARIDTLLASASPPPSRWTRVGAVAMLCWGAIALAGAKLPTPSVAREVCLYSPQIAAELLSAFPQADRDQDGRLSRDEACDLQLEVRSSNDVALSALSLPGAQASSQVAVAWLAGLGCCNCEEAEATSSPSVPACEDVSTKELSYERSL